MQQGADLCQTFVNTARNSTGTKIYMVVSSFSQWMIFNAPSLGTRGIVSTQF